MLTFPTRGPEARLPNAVRMFPDEGPAVHSPMLGRGEASLRGDLWPLRGFVRDSPRYAPRPPVQSYTVKIRGHAERPTRGEARGDHGRDS